MNISKRQKIVKIAILHEMLIKIWGAEKVVESISRLYPTADVFTLLYDEKKVWTIFPKNKVHASCFSLPSQKIYKTLKKQRLCLPFMKKSVEKLDFSAYDTVIVSSSGFAHGLITWAQTKTIIYYHAPARYMWDWCHEYRREIWMNKGIKWFLFGKLLLWLRQWDYEAAQKNNVILANSSTTQKRLSKYYRRDSQILYPPIETRRFSQKINTSLPTSKWKYYIILSALTEFKRIDVAIKHFPKNTGILLRIIGDGEQRNTLESISNQNIEFLGVQYWDNLVSLVQNSLWLIFPGEEDFGMVPIEVMAAGKPVFALNTWWLTETVIAGKTGEFFEDPEGKDFLACFQIFHQNNMQGKYTSQDCKKQAQKFDEHMFQKTLKKVVENIKN